MPSLDLTPDRWSRLEALFTTAVELPAVERERFVARETADDAELRHHLTGMLAHASGAGDRIARAIHEAASQATATATPDVDWVGRRFGPYRVVREIGRGGMGLVFEAVRDDDEYQKRVAVKVAPWWRDVALVRERFRLERQILAGLEHPHIARFLDGGTEDGVPYFVMEYVEGVPITTYCDRQALGLRERLALFRQVCGAVHFAHQRLIVHRDLKPSNVLVAADGTPKLLDFGIAKLVDPVDAGEDDASRAAAARERTMTRDAAWTPDYTSPEQVRGRTVTTRTDVYSLGLVLYELLTGARAQVADTSSPIALDHSICETEPEKPSERVATRGDLDTIVLTAVRKEPERRYESVAALSDDLGRYLDGHPIVARPNTLGYTAWKLLKRHRAGAAAALLIVASLTAGLITTRREAQRAEHRFQQVRTLANAFVFDVHDRIATLPGSTEARKAIVSTALTYLENLRSDAASDAGLARELAAAYDKVGRVKGHPLSANLGDAKGAIESFERAEQLLTPLADRGDRDAQRQLVDVIHHQSTVRYTQGDRPGAVAGLTRASTIGRQLLDAVTRDAAAPSTPSDRKALADTLTVVGDAYADRCRTASELLDFPTAEESGRQAMQIARRLTELDPANRDYRDNLSTALNALAAVHLRGGNLRQSAHEYRESATIREGLLREAPTHVEYRRNLIVSYGNLGDVLAYRIGENLGDVAGAIAVYEKATVLAREMVAQDPVDRRAQFDLSNVLLRYGVVLGDDPARREEGLRQLEEAERITATLLAQDPGSYRHAYQALVITRRMGDVLAALGRTSAAVYRLDTVRTNGAAMMKGSNQANPRLQVVLASSRLAALRAETADPQALTLASFVSAELARQPLDPPVLNGMVHAEIGRVHMTMAGHASGSDGARAERLRAALASFEASAKVWRDVRLDPAVEPTRAKALAAIEGEMRRAQNLISARM